MKNKCVVIGVRNPEVMEEVEDLGTMTPFLVRGVNNGNVIFVGDLKAAVDVASFMRSNFGYNNYDVFQKVDDNGEPVFDITPLDSLDTTNATKH